MKSKKLENEMQDEPPCTTCNFWRRLICVISCKPYDDYVRRQELNEYDHWISRQYGNDKDAG